MDSKEAILLILEKMKYQCEVESRRWRIWKAWSGVAAGPNIHVIRSWAAGQSGDSAYSGEPTVASSPTVKNTISAEWTFFGI